MQYILFFLLLILVGGVSFTFGFMSARQGPTLTRAEKRVIAHYLTQAAESSRMEASALKEVGMTGPSVIDRASDLDALAHKVEKLRS